MTEGCHDSAVAGRAKKWIGSRRNDPVPMLLAVGGCILSVGALVLGTNIDPRGVASNVLADLILVGPALLLSNIIVRRVQDARTRQRIAPLIHVAVQLLDAAVQTGRQALEITDTAAGRDTAHKDRAHGGLTVEVVDAALADAANQLESAMREQPLPPAFTVGEPLRFPRFATISLLLQQANQSYPMPWTIAAANITQDWAQRCGVDFVYSSDTGKASRRRHIGLVEIEEQSEAAGAATSVDALGYLQAVGECLRGAHGISRRLAQEAPPELVRQPLANAIDVDVEGLRTTAPT